MCVYIVYIHTCYDSTLCYSALSTTSGGLHVNIAYHNFAIS